MGHMLGFRHSTKQIGTKVVLISELRAIGQAVRKLRGRDITPLSDSKLAVAMVKKRIDGDDVQPRDYTIERGDGKEAGLVTAQWLIHAQRDRLTPVWAKDHRGEPLNEGADALARLASRYATGTSELTNAEYHRHAARRESFDSVAERVRRAQARIINEHNGQNVLVVSHVRPIKTLLRMALDAGPGILYRLHLDLASLSIAEFYPDGVASVRLVNQTAYLESAAAAVVDLGAVPTSRLSGQYAPCLTWGTGVPSSARVSSSIFIVSGSRKPRVM